MLPNSTTKVLQKRFSCQL